LDERLINIMVNSIEKYIDHTKLAANTTADEIRILCHEAIEYNFAAVCVNPAFVDLADKELKNTDIKICTVIGFPLGATISSVKAYEAKAAIEAGAKEIDMVINIGALKSCQYTFVERDINAVVNTCSGQAIIKVIIETCYLSYEEKIKACKIAMSAGADYVKTSTGFGTYGANIRDISLMKSIVGNNLGIKASGGIKDYQTAVMMIEAGATRIGTSSGVQIVNSKKK